MKYKYRVLSIVIFILIIAFSGQVFSTYPQQIVDDLNRKVIINQQPARIISLAPNITEIIYELDAADKLVGVTKFCNYPLEAQKKDEVSIKTLESIIAQEPDLVLAAGIVPQESIHRLKKLGIKVVGYQAQSISETIETINKIAKIIGHKTAGDKLVAEMNKELEQIKGKVAEKLENKARATVFYEIWRQPLRTVSSGTFIDDLITTAGGENIAASAEGDWPQYSLERLLQQNPDVYIATKGSWKEKVTVDKIKSRPNYQLLKAVQQDRVFVFNADIINRPGPRIIKALRLFTKAIHPQIRLAD